VTIREQHLAGPIRFFGALCLTVGRAASFGGFIVHPVAMRNSLRPTVQKAGETLRAYPSGSCSPRKANFLKQPLSGKLMDGPDRPAQAHGCYFGPHDSGLGCDSPVVAGFRPVL
jgi:hypothetical protein